MTRTAISTLALGMTALISGSNSSVPPTAAGPVAVVNVDAILTQIPAYFTADSLLAKQAQVYRQQFSVEADQLQAEMAKIQSGALGTSEITKQTKIKQLQARNDSLQDKAAAADRRLQELRDQIMNPIETRVTEIIEGQRLSGGYSVVLNLTGAPNTIITFDKSTDITNKVIEAVKANPIAMPAVPGGATAPPVTPPAGAGTRGGAAGAGGGGGGR